MWHCCCNLSALSRERNYASADAHLQHMQQTWLSCTADSSVAVVCCKPELHLAVLYLCLCQCQCSHLQSVIMQAAVTHVQVPDACAKPLMGQVHYHADLCGI